VLVLAMLTSVFAVSELGSQAQGIQRGQQSDLPRVFREVQLKIATTLGGLSYPTMDNATLLSNVQSTQNDAARLAERHGAQMMLRLADRADAYAPLNELNFVSGGIYTAWSYNGSRNFASPAVGYDGVADGVLYNVTAQQVQGVILYVVLADTSARMDATVVLALN
jgi:hypothetical protein